MAEAVYILCALTSGVCAVLLLKHYGRSKVSIVLWTGVCFVALTLTNILLVVDLIVLPAIDLSAWRTGIALLGAMALLYELIRSHA